MNEIYPYPISNSEFIPSSKDKAQQAFNLLDEFRNSLKEADKDTFLKGWFAIHFLALAPHPDELDEWSDKLKSFCIEARRRANEKTIEEAQLYALDAQQQGQRLELDKNLKSYVVGSLDGKQGYLSANFDPNTGNQPCLTGIKAKVYTYDSPQAAANATKYLNLDSYEVYAGTPEQNMDDCPNVLNITLKELQDREVILQREDGLYLYRDGVTWGNSTLRACKYLYYKDNVEAQLQQVLNEFGAKWNTVDYQTILDALDDEDKT